ncbi:carboxypeptidase-like regulatory domain-containing protein [Micromonospora halophytica]|uniref:Carboxypeptidase regulatory-like domain-containing protein n=1 Tax=Micromonospora halophytica TaxID=47864 RepID=A0A1C5JLE8_9ACTN|nr:carboxypeptidase-like regulatory domain-containing protein [Micromonospora halophytica]SCG71434.1 Carboxypeptidase regulatory-like domain-containing protein [Micromonospora halophytica]
MSTHRRAWSQRAGVVVALVAGALLTAPATPALAANVNVSPSSVNLNAGSDTTVSVTVAPSLEDKSGQISITGLPSGVSCANGCGSFQFNGPPGTPKTVLLTLKANDSAPDGNGSATVRVVPDQSDPATAPLSVTVKAKAAPTTKPPETQSVKSISGKVVVAASGDPVPNAYVLLQDSAGKRFEATSDDSGNFRITGSTERPIAPGRLELGASKNNIVATKVINASAGQSLTGQRITLPIKVEVSPSATPSTSVEPVPTEEVTEEATEESAEATPGQPQAASNDEGGGMGSFLVILLGGLLVAAGVGTIVLLWMRRKNADDEDADAPAGAAAGAVPAARGALRGADDRTRVVNRVGAGPDPTMVGGTSLSDAPTMMHRPIVDDVPPDPYGAPPQPYGAGAAAGGWAGSGYGDEPAQGGYGQQGGYGNAPSSGAGYGSAPASGAGYGSAPASGAGYGNAPASGGGYGNEPGYGAAGAAAGGYGNAPASGAGYGNDYAAPAGGPGYAGADQGGGYGERYDEPTGRYTGEPTGNYTPPADPYPTSTYQPEQSYGQAEPAYGQEPTGGYRGGAGYGPQGGGYDAGPRQGYDNGYDQRGGYDQQGGYGAPAGYDQPGGGYGGPQGGYDQQPPQQRGGYDTAGYDQQQGGGYYGDQAPAGRARPDGPPAQDRGGRRLDWLDD